MSTCRRAAADAVGGGGWNVPAFPGGVVHDYDHGKRHDCPEYLPANVRGGTEFFHWGGSTFTDFNLLSASIKARDAHGQLGDSNQFVLGSCVGHNWPHWVRRVIHRRARSNRDVVLLPRHDRWVIDRDVPVRRQRPHHLKTHDASPASVSTPG
jgi:hypothetical protein